MKKRIIKKGSSSLFLLAMLSIMAADCHKKTIPPTVEKGFIAFHLHTDIDTSEVDDYGTVYHNSDSRAMSLSLAQMYISNIKLIKADGSIVLVSGKIILKKKDTEEYYLDSVPAGNYNSVMFDVGLDSATNNASEPPAYDSNNPLSAQTPSMWSGWQWEGYWFLNEQGMIDTSAAKDGSKMAAFNYQIGSQKCRKTITMPTKAFSVQSKQTQFVHMIIDYGKVFNGLNLHTQLTGNYNDPASLQVANNIPLMFSYEE